MDKQIAVDIMVVIPPFPYSPKRNAQIALCLVWLEARFAFPYFLAKMCSRNHFWMI